MSFSYFHLTCTVYSCCSSCKAILKYSKVVLWECSERKVVQVKKMANIREKNRSEI